VEFGLIPEFVGRLPVTVSLDRHKRDDLVRILTEPRNALVRQFQSLFTMEGAELAFEESGLLAIADVALERETGVRALRSILEEILLDLLYELPNRSDTQLFTVDEDVVRGRKQLARGLVSEGLEDEDEVAEKAAGESDSDDAQDGDDVERESA